MDEDQDRGARRQGASVRARSTAPGADRQRREIRRERERCRGAVGWAGHHRSLPEPDGESGALEDSGPAEDGNHDARRTVGASASRWTTRCMLLLATLLVLQTADTARTPGSTRSPVAILVARARAARYQQDSSLASYQAVVRQRMSSGFGIARGLVGAVGRERLAARIESVARVGWHHELGAWGEVIGGRSVAPIVGEYEPGYE